MRGTYKRPVIIEKRGDMTITYRGDNPFTYYRVEGYYEKGNFFAADLHHRSKNSWDWIVGFFNYITRRDRL
jgi:hypothetical protein